MIYRIPCVNFPLSYFIPTAPYLLKMTGGKTELIRGQATGLVSVGNSPLEKVFFQVEVADILMVYF